MSQNLCLENNYTSCNLNKTKNSQRHGNYPDTFSMKTQMRIGAWNVRTLNARGKLEQTVEAIKTLNLKI